MIKITIKLYAAALKSLARVEPQSFPFRLSAGLLYSAMAPRAPSAASQERTHKARAEGRARHLSGPGAMTDIIDTALLNAELTRFYDERDGQQDVSPGLVALNRAKRSLDKISEASKGPTRISKAVTRTLWALLSEEVVREQRRCALQRLAN